MAITDQKEIEAFERGRIVGQREGFALQGVPPTGDWLPGVEFTFHVSWFESFISYERFLTEFLREIQHARWTESREGVEGLVALLGKKIPKADDHGAMLAEHEQRTRYERDETRLAVDAELGEGRGRACIAEAIRASPQVPASVVEFPDVATFIEGDPRRSSPGSQDAKEGAGIGLGGANWRLEDVFKRWETTWWEIAWHTDDRPGWPAGEEATHEVFATESLGSGRIWLFGKLHTREAVDRALDDLRTYAMDERNSVAAAATAVAAVMGEEDAPADR